MDWQTFWTRAAPGEAAGLLVALVLFALGIIDGRIAVSRIRQRWQWE